MQVTLELPAAGYDLPRSTTVYQVDDRARRQLGTLRDTGGSIELALPIRAACILELVPPQAATKQ